MSVPRKSKKKGTVKAKRPKRRSPKGRVKGGGRGRSRTTVIGPYVTRVPEANARERFIWGRAPPSDDALGMSGARVHFHLSSLQIQRNTTYAYYWLYDGSSYTIGSVRTNPLVSVTYGTNLFVNSPLANIIKLYTKYSIRRLRIRYVPTNGLLQSGNLAIAVRSDVDQAYAPSYATVKMYENSVVFPLNKEHSAELIHGVDMSKSAKQLKYMDPSSDSTTNYSLSQEFTIIGATDSLQPTSNMVMGDLEFTGTIDLYGLQGNTAPSLAADRVESKEVKDPYSRGDLALTRPMKRMRVDEDYVEVVEPCSTSSLSSVSTSSSSSGSLPSLNPRSTPISASRKN